MTFKAIGFDGLILESVSINPEAMVSLFDGQGNHLGKVIALHEQITGISWFDKFAMIYRDNLKQPLPTDSREELGRKFSGRV